MRIPVIKQPKVTIPLMSLPTKTSPKRPGSRPQTQPGGKKPGMGTGPEMALDNLLGELQAQESGGLEQGGNHEDLASHISLEGDKDEVLQRLSGEHEKLIDLILEEEDQLIDSHKRHIDAVMELAKKEMSLLQEVSKPGSDITDYVKGLNAILEHKQEIISVLRSRLLGFYCHLRQEEDICKKVNEFQQQTAPADKKPEGETDLLKDEVRLEDFDNPKL